MLKLTPVPFCIEVAIVEDVLHLLHGTVVSLFSQGRAGLGNLYVWASGNGGAYGDSCAYDGYASSRFTLTVSAVSQTGTAPWYAEPCSAVLAAVFSSGSRDEHLVVCTCDSLVFTLGVINNYSQFVTGINFLFQGFDPTVGAHRATPWSQHFSCDVLNKPCHEPHCT